MDEKERKEQEREDFRKTGGMVTRIEFYTCFMVLVALILWRGGLVNQNLEMRIWNAEKNTIHEIDALWNDVNREIEAIPGRVMMENESMFSDRRLFLAEVDRKEQTFLLKLTGTPKEYHEGIEGTFFVSCDSGEPVAIPAEWGESRQLHAEAELPFCETVYVSVALKSDGTEKVQNFGEVNAQMDYGLVPEFSGGLRSYRLMPKKDWLLHDGVISIDISAGEAQGLSFDEGTAELQIDGETVQTMQAKKEYLGGQNWNFQAEQTEKFELKEGQTLSVIFKITDNDGVMYTYLAEQLDVTKDGLEGRQPEGRGVELLKNGRLTIE